MKWPIFGMGESGAIPSKLKSGVAGSTAISSPTRFSTALCATRDGLTPVNAV